MMARPDGRARAQGRVAAMLGAICSAALALSYPSAAKAGELSVLALAAATEPETLVVEIVLNGETKGQFFVSAAEGDLLIRVQDLRGMGLVDVRGRVHRAAGEEMIALKSVEGVSAVFDERNLVLQLTVDPGLLPPSTVDFAAGRKQRVFYPTDPSAFFNYDVSYSGGNAGQRGVAGVATEVGARMGDFLFLSDSTYYAEPSRDRFVRLMTSLVHDDRQTLVRTVLGDFVVSAGDLSSSVSMAGLSYSKLYGINPYFVSYPQQNLSGMLRAPSEVEVYIDGQRVRTLRLPAGEFNLRDVTQAPGLRNVQLVIRDAFGREQRINAPFYSTPVPLKAGLHEYSYNVGALREMFGVESNEYGPLAFAGFHRYGINDALTLGAHAEGRSGVCNAGATATMVLGAAGVLSVSGAGSGNDGRSGSAALVGYSYLGTHFNAGLLLRKQTPNYVQLSQTGTEHQNYAIGATVGYTDTGVGSLSAGYSTLKTYDRLDSRSASLSYGRVLLDGRASFVVTAVNTSGRGNGTNVFATFIYNFDATYALSARYERFRGNDTEALQFQKAQPVGEGLGYTIAAERTGSPEGTTTVLNPSFQYNGKWGILSGSASQQSDGDRSHTSYALSFAGGIAWVGGALSAGRPVTDAFGIVKVDNIEGVRVFVNNEEIGRTDANGMVVLPTLTSFVDNQVSIKTSNVPLDVSFPESMRVVSPPYRGGAVIDFHATRLTAVAGTLNIRSAGEVKPAQFFQVTLSVEGKPLSFPTGRGGEYYIENVKPGRYAARLASNGQSCMFELVVPETREPLTELPEIVCDSGR